MSQIKIAILGAGIAGLSCAIALKQKGFNVTVYERSPEPKNLGAGLVLWPNAIHILDKLELLSEIQSLGFTLDKMQRFTEFAEFLNEIDLKQLDTKTHYANYSISRKSLQNILINKIQQLNINIKFNHNISNIEEHKNKSAVVYFDNGDKLNAHIIIGADGRMKSIARKYVSGNNKPIYQDYVNWVGLIEKDSNINFKNNIVDYWGCGERFGIVPLSNHSAYWAGCKAMPEGMGEPIIGNKKTLLSIFKDWPDEIASIIKHTPDQHIKRIEVYDQDPIPNWYRNNVCLIGDAAHAALPSSGQGACQAIEDAYILAECLQQAENIQSVTNYQSVFEQFTNTRYKTTTNIIENARDFTRSLFNTNPEFCKNRNRNAKH
jgi:2-polyprenyl-6-methoxyphenol hydroxylase-like FAD-dependent oxidoreductase